MVKRKRAKADYVQLNVRMKESLRREIEKAADRSEVSMNSEVVRRLERSFADNSRFGGPRLIELVETIARTMKTAGEFAGFLEAHKSVNEGRWLALPYAFDQAAKAAMAVLEHHRPPGEIVEPDWSTAKVVGGDAEQSQEMVQQALARLGELFAARELRDKEERE